ncbi:hypothetical protein [Sphingomonas sp. CCH5-D11]|uniref:hypothetical protein n=1 Tax=Sphingomonas sp. CCH5-D11 TaxID=1768786 RepID=UPI0012E36AF8|nr:hypothetical protein [Sphingomonas sp. CCH5-D11]
MTETRRRVLLAGAGLASVALIAPAAAASTGAVSAEWTQAVADWHAAHATVMQYNAVPGVLMQAIVEAMFVS